MFWPGEDCRTPFAAHCWTGCRQRRRNKQHGENTNDGRQYHCCAESAGVSGFASERTGRNEDISGPDVTESPGIRPSEAEQRLCRQRVWVGNDTLMTPREQHFYRALLRHTSRKRWLLCPQVRVADIATLAPHIRPRSRTRWQLFRMASQWHCDVVIVDIRTFAIVGAIELDDASHLKNSVSGAISCWKRF